MGSGASCGHYRGGYDARGIPGLGVATSGRCDMKARKHKRYVWVMTGYEDERAHGTLLGVYTSEKRALTAQHEWGKPPVGYEFYSIRKIEVNA